MAVTNATLKWIQQKATEIKQMFPDVKIPHKKLVSLASEEYRNENGTIRAKKHPKSTSQNKTKKTKEQKHVCPNCNYIF
jgi:hypothetical protein